MFGQGRSAAVQKRVLQASCMLCAVHETSPSVFEITERIACEL